MVTPLVKPASMLQPFANIGGRNAIPNTPDATPGHASYDLGFPPLTRTPIEQGGIPPSGLDMNGIAYEISAHAAWINAGGQYTFDAALAAFTGGYKLGAIVQSNDGLSSYRSMVNNNTDNFNTTPSAIGVTWEAYAGQAVNGSVSTVAVTGGNVTLTATQAAAAIINVTGVLTANATVTFPTPAAARSWRITNSTTGAFTLGAKLATGGTLALTQTKSNQLFYNGAALQYGDWDSGLDSPALRGSPTAPTAAPGTNNTQLATTEYCDLAAAAIGVSFAPQYVGATMTAGVRGDYWVNTEAGPFTITLPAVPISHNILEFHDLTNSWGVNALTINPGSNQIQGYAVSEVLICDVRAENAVGLWWDTINLVWRIK